MKLAFDRSSRFVDADGRLHVAVSNISKACVSPYLGSEIPDSEELGLDPSKFYMLLRDPTELAKGAATFNNLPLQSKHIAQNVNNPQKESIIGSTGTDAAFVAPYLQNSLVVWDAIAIAGINTREQCELSCSYRYKAVMTPGTYDGVAYDGIMTDIIGNHVAVVEVGRAGPDVIVGDEQPKISLKPPELITMKMTRTAVAVQAAIAGYLMPRLAADAAIGDTKAFVRGVTSATFAQDKARILAEVGGRFNGVKPEELDRVIQFAADSVPEDDKDDKKAAMDEDDQREDESDEDYAKRKAAKEKKADDAEADAAKEKDDGKKAMDAAIGKATAAVTQRLTAARAAENEVRPLLGDILAQDSAETVYKMALDHMKVDVTGVDPSAYGAMFRALSTQAAAKATPEPRIANDAALSTDFAARYPTAGKLKRSI